METKSISCDYWLNKFKMRCSNLEMTLEEYVMKNKYMAISGIFIV